MSAFNSMEDRNAIEAEASWGALAEALPATAYGLLGRTRDRFPDRPAISFQLTSGPTDPAETLSWREMHGQVTQAANLFHSLGVGPEDTVAYILPNCLETPVVLLGAMTAGRVGPINPLLEPEQIAAILREMGASIVVTLKSMPKTDVAQRVAEALVHAPNVRTVLEVDLARYLPIPKRWLAGLARPKQRPHHRAKVLDYATSIRRMRADALEFPERPADRVAAMFHTGGTTGLPKLVQHRQDGMIYNGWLGHRLLFTETDVLICPLPMFHVFAAYPVMMSCLASGAHAVFPTPQGYRGAGVIANFWKLVERWRVSFLITVPTAVAALMQRKVDADVSSLRLGISGSAALPSELWKRFEAATGVQIAEGYGLTEATCLVSCNPPGGKKKVGSVGIPFPHTRVRIVLTDDDGRITGEAARDEVGEICIANPGVLPGRTYREAEKNTGLFTEDGYLRTGDMGRLDEEGYLWITGRKKDLIIRGGHNIDPGVIEEALLSHPAVAFAGAIGQPDAFGGEMPCTYVELVEGAEVTTRELAVHCGERLSERAGMPKHIEVLPELPKTAVGKIYKPDLRKRAIARVYGAALVKARLPVEVATVFEDRKRGLVARLRSAGPVEDVAVAEVLGVFTVPWEWAEGSGPGAGDGSRA